MTFINHLSAFLESQWQFTCIFMYFLAMVIVEVKTTLKGINQRIHCNCLASSLKNCALHLLIKLYHDYAIKTVNSSLKNVYPRNVQRTRWIVSSHWHGFSPSTVVSSFFIVPLPVYLDRLPGFRNMYDDKYVHAKLNHCKGIFIFSWLHFYPFGKVNNAKNEIIISVNLW